MATYYLEHHGIRGQKWGVRRYQNPDGTWTEEGKRRYGSSGPNYDKKQRKQDLKDLKDSYKKAKYASAVTNDYEYKYWNAKRYKNDADAENAYERGSKSRQIEHEITQEAFKKYNDFVEKYGDTKVKDIQFLTDDGGTRVTMNGKKEVYNILNSSLRNYTIAGTVILGPIAGIAGGAYGYTKDQDRRMEYEKRIG